MLTSRRRSAKVHDKANKLRAFDGTEAAGRRLTSPPQLSMLKAQSVDYQLEGGGDNQQRDLDVELKQIPCSPRAGYKVEAAVNNSDEKMEK